MLKPNLGNRSLSIRLRLTLLYTGILALTLIVFSSSLYLAQTQTTYDDIKINLIHQAEGFAHNRGASPQYPGGPGGEPPGDASRLTSRPSTLPEGTLPGRWMQTRTLTGTVVGQTLDLNAEPLPLSKAGLAAVQSGSAWFETGQAEEQPVLVYSMPFTGPTGEALILQVAFPITQPQQQLNALRLILLLGSGLAILAACVVGWALAGTALNPIHRITHTAQVIGAEHDFSRRVTYTGPADEVGQLAFTFNGMLTELESAYRQMKDSLDSQRRFVADASHELRTPLTTVRGNMELLRREPPIEASDRAEILSDTTDEVDRLIRLVNQLLVLARADAGQKLRAESIPLGPLIDDVCRQAKCLDLDNMVTYAGDLEATVLGDRDAVKQVMLILLDNAHRHTESGTTVEVLAESLDGQVAIHVRDTGPGIPPDMLPHIFERFYRGEVARSGPGSGLGLAIAKDLLGAQGGTISVSSQVGQGTTFTVVLPAAPADVQEG